MNIKRLKTILLTTGLSIGITLSFSVQAQAATYTTVSGDSLYKISRIFHTTVGDLMDDNNLKNYDLNIGQKLYVPCGTYTVEKGDTLFLISQKFNVSLESLRRANNIYTNYIDIGQILNIPAPISPSITDTNINNTESTPAPAPVQETKTETVQETEPTPAPVQTEAVAYSENDLDVLSRLIMAETESQPYEAKVAVGAVVINRVKSGLFADSIYNVVYQNINGYYQFTPVENGWINNPANEECIKAAKEALSGVDPSNGALFYYDNSSTNQWILSKPISVTIGAMIYAY